MRGQLSSDKVKVLITELTPHELCKPDLNTMFVLFTFALLVFIYGLIELIDSYLMWQVEIVMGLEEEFGLNIEDDNAEDITTIQEAADLIEKLVQKKDEA
jgi:hypothetical protein